MAGSLTRPPEEVRLRQVKESLQGGRQGYHPVQAAVSLACGGCWEEAEQLGSLRLSVCALHRDDGNNQ